MSIPYKSADVVIIGAGAAGLMCAIEAGKRHRKVIVIDHANKPGKKILMSGGGRCNFTNYEVTPDKFISHNPHFCKSALSRYTQWDFINLVKKHNIPFHEKILGQLFCDNKSKAIVEMLLSECQAAAIEIYLDTEVKTINKFNDYDFRLNTSLGILQSESLVIATGGLSIPTMGSSAFGYKVAEQFDIKVWPTRAGLVPLTLHTEDKEKLAALAGVSINATVSNQRKIFTEGMLFTHRGLSGPAVLQISSYWNPGEALIINTLPSNNLSAYLKLMQQQQPQKLLKTILAELLPKRMIETLISSDLLDKKLISIQHQDVDDIVNQLNSWIIKPNGTEGYRTAEVTLGGVDCNSISSKTMEANKVPGLYFIGEVLDVTGWLGGYNFQWAWSSGWAAGQVV